MTNISLISIFDSVPTWVMLLPIVICSIIVLAIVIERMIFYRTNSNNFKTIMSRVIKHVNINEIADAKSHCLQFRGTVVRMIYNILDGWVVSDERSQVIRGESENAILHIEKYGNIISTIATVAPMLGLLGTVTGMMKAFSALSKLGPASHNNLALGITESLVTTAFGLIVAIPASIFYNYMVNKAMYLTKEIEFIANTFIEADEKNIGTLKQP